MKTIRGFAYQEVNCLHWRFLPKAWPKASSANKWMKNEWQNFIWDVQDEGGEKMNGLEEELWKIPWIRNNLSFQRNVLPIAKAINDITTESSLLFSSKRCDRWFVWDSDALDTIVKWQKVWHDKLFQCKVFLRFF